MPAKPPKNIEYVNRTSTDGPFACVSLWPSRFLRAGGTWQLPPPRGPSRFAFGWSRNAPLESGAAWVRGGMGEGAGSIWSVSCVCGFVQVCTPAQVFRTCLIYTAPAAPHAVHTRGTSALCHFRQLAHAPSSPAHPACHRLLSVRAGDLGTHSLGERVGGRSASGHPVLATRP